MSKVKSLEKFLTENKIEHHKNIKFSTISTIGIGGKVKCVVKPNSTDELANLVNFLNENFIKWFVIGNGSNSIGAFNYYNGVVIELGLGFDYIKQTSDVLEVGAKTSLIRVAKFGLDSGLSGIEWAVGIPGQVGGAVCMNAGAFGTSMFDILESVTFLNEKCELETIEKKDMKKHYRGSMFLDTLNIIVSAKIKLVESESVVVAENISKVNKERVASLVLGKSVGSTFKNPEGMFAGKLIDEAGLKGFRYKNLMISPAHANIIVNTKKATYKDYEKMTEKIKEKVLENSGVTLELEPIIFRN